MKLVFYKEKNFGDRLNLWLWDQLIPDVIDNDETTAFVGLGTLLNDNLPNKTRKAYRKVIFSTGVGYGSGLPKLDESYKIYCVRGLLSAQALGLPTKLAVTDGAVLVRRLLNINNRKVERFAYMPHYEMAGEGWRAVCEDLGFGYIDPRWSTEKILSLINQTEVLLTEAMHGAIVADALRIPWVPIVTNPTILAFKWQDWCSSIGLEYRPVQMKRLHHPSNKVDILSPVRLARDWSRQKQAALQLSYIAKNSRPLLSSDILIEQLTIELEEKLQQLKKDIKSGISGSQISCPVASNIPFLPDLAQ
ncbi:MAG TPA: succinoglycan biosynthesis ketolase [Cyanobacteria bacterium UBA8803]|nr:succinoglycan biosynthesis ketolase [Cyanobacteria bacterium UBA9273]HBL62252.1 succinoglycan biosynthesis ketolase [Cyanobacteria bacterium UBA8803]